MLMERKIALVPAQPELDADQAEFGRPSLKTCAAYGEAAVSVGTPDYFATGDREERLTMAADAIANILHHLSYDGLDPDLAIERARMHHHAEITGAD